SKTLEESADGLATTNKIMPKISDVDSRDLRLFHVKAATITSSKLHEDDNVANQNRHRNKLKNKLPKGICENASGNTKHHRSVPRSGAKPNAKTTGKIAKPASNETNTFIVTTQLAEDVKLTFLFK